ncbi:MAG: hypothetical protein ABRQ37_19120, partial [Candidatus Eremiobacterota bacterium]
MKYRMLFVFIEGDDDERFFHLILKPEFEKKYNTVKLWKYAQEEPDKTRKFLKSIEEMNKDMHVDYIYVSDIDLSPCISGKKEKIQDKIKNIDRDNIIVVIKEIESWYLAGLSNEDLKKLTRITMEHTDDITKEQFDRLMSKKFTSRIDFMMELLKYFSIDTAKQK